MLCYIIFWILLFVKTLYVCIIILSQALSLKNPRHWKMSSKRFGETGAVESWMAPPPPPQAPPLPHQSLKCQTPSTFAAAALKASLMTRLPNVSRQKNLSRGTCWPGATITSSTLAPDWPCCGVLASSSVMGSCCPSGEQEEKWGSIKVRDIKIQADAYYYFRFMANNPYIADIIILWCFV